MLVFHTEIPEREIGSSREHAMTRKGWTYKVARLEGGNAHRSPLPCGLATCAEAFQCAPPIWLRFGLRYQLRFSRPLHPSLL